MKLATPDGKSANPTAEDPSPESRRYARRPIGLPVELTLTDGERRSGICRDISLGGLHIDVAEPAPLCASVTILIELTGIEGITALPGIVRWSTADSMGVQLGLFSTQVTHAIIRILADS
jgi:hypothetical protein